MFGLEQNCILLLCGFRVGANKYVFEFRGKAIARSSFGCELVFEVRNISKLYKFVDCIPVKQLCAFARCMTENDGFI